MLGAVTAASASAEACTKKAGSTHVALCIEGQKFEAMNHVNVKQASTTATLTLPESWPPMEWVCTKVQVGLESGEFISVAKESGGNTLQLKFEPTWSGCTTKYSGVNMKCAMPREQRFSSQPGTFANSAGKVTMKSVDFVEFFVTNKSETEICQTIRGLHHVGGAYECKFQQPEVEASQHELICESHGSETRIEEKPVTIKYAVNVELNFEKKKFSVYEY
jgi:hypothetical protein